MRSEFLEKMLTILEDAEFDMIKQATALLLTEYQRGYQVGDQDISHYTILSLLPFADFSTDDSENESLALTYDDNESIRELRFEHLQVLVDDGAMTE